MNTFEMIGALIGLISLKAFSLSSLSTNLTKCSLKFQ